MAGDPDCPVVEEVPLRRESVNHRASTRSHRLEQSIQRAPRFESICEVLDCRIGGNAVKSSKRRTVVVRYEVASHVRGVHIASHEPVFGHRFPSLSESADVSANTEVEEGSVANP